MRCRVRGRERKYSRPTGSRTSVDRLSRAVLPPLGQPCSPQFYILARCNKAPLPLPVAVSAPVSADLALLSLLLYPRSRLCNLIHQQFHCSPFVPLWIDSPVFWSYLKEEITVFDRLMLLIKIIYSIQRNKSLKRKSKCMKFTNP